MGIRFVRSDRETLTVEVLLGQIEKLTVGGRETLAVGIRFDRSDRKHWQV